MLAELKALHADLRDAIDALKSEAAREAPNDEHLAVARLKLSRLSRQRRALLESSVYPLLGDVTGVSHLRQEAVAMLAGSSEHIGRWNTRAIHADWAGYKRASAAMRSKMLKRIGDESRILYPLLEALPHGHHASSGI